MLNPSFKIPKEGPEVGQTDRQTDRQTNRQTNSEYLLRFSVHTGVRQRNLSKKNPRKYN